MEFKKIIQGLFYADKWNIGFINQSISGLISNKKLNKITWLKEDNSDCSADPFVIRIDGIVYIYYEFLNYWHGRGKIYQINNLDFTTRKQVHGFSPSKIHLSYPYIFTEEKNIYCIPETAQANEVVLYDVRQTDTTLLNKRRILLSGSPYLDTSIIKFNSKYWIFTSRRDRVGQFFIFYANSLSDEFLPHLLNPIFCDLRSIRGAGHLFIDNGVLYRPTQNSTSEYGGSIIVNKINKLTEKTFESEIAFELLADKQYKDGIHNISFINDLIVIDGKRKVYSPVMLIKKLIREFRSFQARLSFG